MADGLVGGGEAESVAWWPVEWGSPKPRESSKGW
jgi:hypothetical protein